MTAPTAPNPHDEVATRIGTVITQQLWRVLPEFAAALGPQMLDSCEFKATVVFRNSTAGIMVDIQTDKDVPTVPADPIALGWSGQAMSLLPQDPAPPVDAQPAPQQAGTYNQNVQQPPPPMMGQQAMAAAQPPPRQDPFPGRRRPLADEGGVS